MSKGGYQIIDLSNYTFQMNLGGGPPTGTTKEIDNSFIPQFMNKKAKLISGLKIKTPEYTISNIDDMFVENIKTIETAERLIKYYHIHIEVTDNETDFSAYSYKGALKVEINKATNRIYITLAYWEE